jgi:hypothetical protein
MNLYICMFYSLIMFPIVRYYNCTNHNMLYITVCRISEIMQVSSDSRQAGAPSSGSNPVAALNTTFEPHTQRPLLQPGASAGHAVQGSPTVYTLPPIILPPGP